MKKTIAFLMLAFSLTGSIYAQTEDQDKTDEEQGKVIRMNKEMFVDDVFDYTTGSTDWKYKGEKPAVIDFYATWCGPCRMISPILKSLAKEYKDQIVVYKVDTDKEKELSAAMGIQSLPTVVFIPKIGQPQIIVGAADKATFKRAIEEVLLKK
ncbi:thioredoxin [Phocaeicola sp.]